ncbi:DUF58 domain-containing protein [Marinicella sp. W31]|uniref:DUF58 domain-containing protein n=1 Tax=Marinicella sp. W31 TaxID=3023713 RepID=UPI003756A0FE
MASSTKLRFFDRLVDKFVNKRGREALPIALHWKRIYIFPSKAGIYLFLIWGVMLLAGLNFNNNMALMLVFLIFGIAHICLYQAFFNMKDLLITSVDASPVFLGEDIHVNIGLKGNRVREDICLDDYTGRSIRISIQDKEPGQLQFPLPTEKRGWQKLPKLKMYTRYPLGLFTAWVVFQPQERVLVYPRPEEPCPDFPKLGGIDGFKVRESDGEEIHSMRDYRPGDPVRDIAWKKSAQQDNTVVKEYQSQQGQQLEFSYEHIHLSGVEAKLSRLTAWVNKAEQMGIEYQLRLPDFDSGIGSGQQQLKNCLQILALFGEDE